MRGIGLILFALSLIAGINAIGPSGNISQDNLASLIASFWLMLAAIFFAAMGKGKSEDPPKNDGSKLGMGEKKCPHCEHVFPKLQKYCPKCGKDEEGNEEG